MPATDTGGVPPSSKAGTHSRGERFGFSRVSAEEKTQRVRGVFDSVANRYDLMNDLMSFGAHRLWKKFALARTGLRPGGVALDVAGGTGDLAIGMGRQVGASGTCTAHRHQSRDAAGRPQPAA